MLTEGEKLIAAMLADLMSGMGIKGEVDPDFVRETITSGQTWALRWKYSGLFHGDDRDDEIARETAKILSMCSFVEWSIEQLDPAELAQIPQGEREVFRGFDGNGEDHFGVAKFMVEKLDMNAEFAGRAFNSHYPMVAKYLRQVDAWDHVRGNGGPLTLDQIQTILAA